MMNSSRIHEQQQQQQHQEQQQPPAAALLGRQHQQQPRRRPKVLCLGVSFPCIEQSARQAGISLPQSVTASTSSYFLAEQRQYTLETKTSCDDIPGIISEYSSTSPESSNVVCDSSERLPLENGSKNSSDGNNEDDDINQITAMVQDCVQRNILTQMDGRDLIRCLITERCCNVDVYTVSQECGAVYNKQRHLHANFNRSNFVAKLQRHFSASNSNGDSTTTPTTTILSSLSSSDSDESNKSSSPTTCPILFKQIILDYFWIPQGWDTEHWARKFFSQVLVDLCRVLQAPSSNGNGDSSEGGVVYLPFCYHCFQQVLACRDILTQHYNVSFVRKGTREMEQICLWHGTRQINTDIMQNVFGKRLDQEEVYCTFGPRHVQEVMDDGYISKAKVLDTCRRLEDFHDIRFIALRRIPGAVDGAFSSCSSSLPSIPPDAETNVPSAAAVTFPTVSTSHGQGSRRIVPIRTCRQSEPNKAATTIFNEPAPSTGAASTKRNLFSMNNTTHNTKDTCRSKKKQKRNHNRGSILGLQHPQTIQRGFFSPTTSAISSSDNNTTFVTSSITNTTTTRVVTPTPAAKEHNGAKKQKLQSYDEDEVDMKPKALF
jgi:hypothetical protein